MGLLGILHNLYTKYRVSSSKKSILATVKSCGDNLHVNAPCRFNNNTYLGNNVNLNGMAVGGSGKIVIGDNFHSGSECQIITNIHNYDHGTSIPYDANDIQKDVIIEDNVWIGNRVIILGGAILREGCIIQAGSVVVGEIPYCAIAGGHPAKVFKMRDVEHYESLKAQGKFM